MKKIFLFTLFCLTTGCASNKAPYCEQYQYKNNNQSVNLFFKEGRIQKETSTGKKTSSQQGLYKFQNKEINVFIKDNQEIYTIKNEELIAKNNSNITFKCH